MCTKKGAPRPALWHTAGLGAPFPGYKYWHALGWRSIIRQAVSLRLMEGGASDECRPKLHRWPFSMLSLVAPPIPLEASPVFMCLPWRPAGRTQRRMPPRCKPTHHRYPDRRGWKRSRGLGACQAIGPGYHTPVSPCQQAFFLVWWASSPVFPMRYCLLDFHTLTNHLLQGMPPHPEACFLRLTLLDSFSPVSYHGLVSLHAPLFRRETLRVSAAT